MCQFLSERIERKFKHKIRSLVKESLVNLLNLNPVEVSTQLMVEDFTIFRQIEATEYVDDLYELEKSRYGTPSLSTCSSHVFTNPEFSICFYEKKTSILCIEIYFDSYIRFMSFGEGVEC